MPQWRNNNLPTVKCWLCTSLIRPLSTPHSPTQATILLKERYMGQKVDRPMCVREWENDRTWRPKFVGMGRLVWVDICTGRNFHFTYATRLPIFVGKVDEAQTIAVYWDWTFLITLNRFSYQMISILEQK